MKTKIRIVILLLTLIVLALIEGFFFISHNCFQDMWNAYKNKYRRDKEYAMMHTQEVEIATLPSVGNPGYDYRIIRHSGGVFPVRYIQILWKHGMNPTKMDVGYLMQI